MKRVLPMTMEEPFGIINLLLITTKMLHISSNFEQTTR